MAQIFISYSRSNQDVIQTLVEDLEITGNEIWFDKTLTGGQPWWDNILENIRKCDIFILALSPESLESDACKREWNYADKLGKMILPLRLSEMVNVNLLPRHLSKIQVTDYLRQDKKTAFALIKAINGLPPSSPLPDPLPKQPPVPVSYLGTLKEEIEVSRSLNLEEQIALVFKLKAGLSEGRPVDEVRGLLLRMKQRDDLLAKVGTEIDTVLKSIKETVHFPQEEKPFGSEKEKSFRALSDDEEETQPLSVHEERVEIEDVDSIPCAKCGKENDSLSKFCGNCGTPLTIAVTQNLQVPQAERGDVKTRRFACSPERYDRLIEDLKTWLEGQDYNCQHLTTEQDGVLLQVAQKGSWRKFVGMSTSLNVVFRQKGDTVAVEIGAGKWIDKAAAGTVSLFVLWPLAVTAGIGAWQQMKLPEKIFDYIGNRLVRK